jgi:hypothetical protein
MKKIIALMLAMVMVVCVLASCNSNNATSGTTAGTQGSGTQGTTAGTTEAPIVKPQDESLLVWLDFSFDNLDESGDVPFFTDMSGHGNHGYVGGIIDVTDGYDGEGEAATIKGEGDYLTIKHNDVFNFKAEDNYTIDLWFKADTSKIYSHHSWPCLFTKGSPNATSYFGCWFNNSKGKDSVYFGTGTYDIETGTNVTGNKNAAAMTGVLNEEWHHFVAVQKDGKIYTYVDGKAGATEVAKDITNTWDIYIGGKVGVDEAGADKLQQFFGDIDEFKIYNRALSYTEIAGIVVEKPEKEELVLDLDFANMADGKVNDLTGKGHEGTVTGNVTVKDGAAKFDNSAADSASYITIKNSEALQFKRNQSFTVEITFKYDEVPGGWHCLMQAGLNGQGWYGVWHAGGTSIAWGGVGGNKYATKTAIEANKWHTMTIVQNAETGEVTTYFDGVKGETLLSQNYVFGGDIYLGAEVKTLTDGVPTGFACLYNGYIKNLKVYNYALDMAQ